MAIKSGHKLISVLNSLLFFISFLSLFFLVLRIGYNLSLKSLQEINQFFNYSLFSLSFFGQISLIYSTRKYKSLPLWIEIVFYFNLITIALILFSLIIGEDAISEMSSLGRLLVHPGKEVAVFVLSLIQISGAVLRFLNSHFMPARLFALSFLFSIFLGSLLLFLPNSHNGALSYIDSLFTATSAVCITGLTAINVGEILTPTGQMILLFLIQIGGLGILTFTTFLGMMAVGKTSVVNNVIIKNLLDQSSFNNIFRLMRVIFVTTLSIETLGALYIYFIVGSDNYGFGIFNSVFHSVSAFCNAGFSTLPEGLQTNWLADNYAFLTIISLLIVVGSLGFPVVNEIRLSLIECLRRVYAHLFGFKDEIYTKRNLSVSSRLSLSITILLLVGGALFFLLSENNGILKGHSAYEKTVLSFFMSATPRSGGFNSYPMMSMSHLSVLFTIILMWIGGGPLSTAGGIKTTTFGLSLVSIWNIMKGRDFVQFRNRRIASSSVLRASALIFISLGLASIGVVLITYFNPEISLQKIIFEVVSAVSTCGLSLDTTAQLSSESKIVLMIFMFFGRVGLLVILESLVSNSENKDITYPQDIIAIG